MLDLLETALSKASGPWLELRLHDRRTRSISVDNGRTESARTVRHCGVGVRAFVDGAWGFASTSLLTVAAIERATAVAGCTRPSALGSCAVSARIPSRRRVTWGARR